MACQGLLSNEILFLLRRLTEAELVDDASSLHSDACLAAAIFFLRVPAAPVAEDLPGDLWRASDEEVEAPHVRAVVARRGREDGAPPKREAPEHKDLRARYPVVSSPAAGRAYPCDHIPQNLEAIARGQLPVGYATKRVFRRIDI